MGLDAIVSKVYVRLVLESCVCRMCKKLYCDYISIYKYVSRRAASLFVASAAGRLETANEEA
eukprot:scaffold1225_cov164-Amphora_coffeaeformis.AAC.15